MFGRGASSIHFKFQNAREYSTITFDGPYIALSELKKEIFASQGFTAPDADLRVTNANTKEGTHKEDKEGGVTGYLMNIIVVVVLDIAVFA